jgi:hypothetical protein
MFPGHATELARQWLRCFPARTDAENAHRQLGLQLCDCVETGVFPAIPAAALVSAALPDPTTLVRLDRSAFLELSRNLNPSASIDERKKHALSELAVSFARSGDLQVVAAIVRMAAELGIQNDRVSKAQQFLLDHQQPGGSFGLFEPELSALGDGETGLVARLAMTVEVLRALAAIAGSDANLGNAPSGTIERP